MKKRFTFEVMYGDADGYDTFKHITERQDEIDFLTYFLENYNRDVFHFYNRPDLLKYNSKFKNNEEELISVVNNMVKLANIICEKEDYGKIKMVEEDAFKEEIHESLAQVISFVNNWFDWWAYHAGMDYAGCPDGYNIEDITGCTEMTKQEVIELVKEKLNMNIVITD